MIKEDILKIIRQGENQFVEFKSSTKILTSVLGKTITAFLNSKGGKILLGIKEPNEIIGIEKESINKFKVFNLGIVESKIKPKASFSFETINVDGKIIGIIDVPEGKTKPYGFSGTYFKREGEIIVEMVQTDLLEFYNTQEKYDKRTITEILEKVKSIEIVLKDKIQNKFGTNIFISHGHHPEIRAKVVDFIESLELNPIVVMESASEGLSVDDKVEKFIKKCSASIILYTPDDELKDGAFLPRPNVIHETGILQREMPDKIIYVKEKSVKLPTNLTPKVYVSFEKDNLTDCFIQIIKELKSFGIYIINY